MLKYSTYILIIFLSLTLKSFCQDDDWDTILDEELSKQRVFTTATFKSSRILNGQSVECLSKGGLDFRVAHRFAEFNTNENNFLGFDEASTYFGLYYSIVDQLNIGIARATYNQTNYGFVKYAFLRQSTGEKNIPLTMVFNSSISYISKQYSDKERDEDFISRMDYSFQLLIGRKFSERLSLQLTPTLVHRNLVETKNENNDLYAIGIGGRYLITRRIAFNAEYYWVLNNTGRYGYDFYDPVALGFDIQFGSHVFQLMLTNVAAMTENKFIGETSSDFFSGDIRFGFNISQVFSLTGSKQ
ncbi:MAG: DUF5777 family beta-barrel protein [Bacteroidales bacterium]|nr:DUF5777 family beta-barrel protein [Bacteroidales bacterium]